VKSYIFLEDGDGLLSRTKQGNSSLIEKRQTQTKSITVESDRWGTQNHKQFVGNFLYLKLEYTFWVLLGVKYTIKHAAGLGHVKSLFWDFLLSYYKYVVLEFSPQLPEPYLMLECLSRKYEFLELKKTHLVTFVFFWFCCKWKVKPCITFSGQTTYDLTRG